MRNRRLHDALRDFALEAAAALQAVIQEGAELPFELAEERGAGAVLYRYDPLTAEFIAERWPSLRELPSCAPACEALGRGARSYLRVQGLSGVEAEPALQALLERLYADATSFEFPEERFERVYAEVERTLFADSARVRVVAPLLGVRLEQVEVELGDGLALSGGEAADAPAEALWMYRGQDESEPNVLCILERELDCEAPLAAVQAGDRLRRLVTALRLFKEGVVSLGPSVWTRIDEGPWTAAPLGAAPVCEAEPWTLAHGEEQELRELVAIVEGARPAPRTSWALRRFELGCERPSGLEALSDHLLALRALLDAGDDAGRASLPLRVAALCADDPDRRATQRRIEEALALERSLMSGADARDQDALAAEVEGHLRALLRDVLCGYLDEDLKGTADEILLRGTQPVEIHARDLRAERAPESAEPERVEPLLPPSEPEGVEPLPPPSEPEQRPEPVPARPSDTVTPSADWGFDDDPASYSAPV